MFSTFEKLLDRQLSIIDKMARDKTRNRRLTGVVIIWSFLKNTCKHLIFVLSSNKKIVNGHCSAGK